MVVEEKKKDADVQSCSDESDRDITFFPDRSGDQKVATVQQSESVNVGRRRSIFASPVLEPDCTTLLDFTDDEEHA